MLFHYKRQAPDRKFLTGFPRHLNRDAVLIQHVRKQLNTVAKLGWTKKSDTRQLSTIAVEPPNYFSVYNDMRVQGGWR